MADVTLLSYAKLNLVLQIKGRRGDGFHELQTVFERIDLCDQLTFRPARDGQIQIVCNHPGVPCDQRNLVYKAAELLRAGEGVKAGARIQIEKKIPVAAGLAGGSSNGATALVGLNRLWRLNLSRKKLIAYAKELGSDVAFFLYDAPFALGTGRGEMVQPLDVKARLWHVLVTPRTPLLTKDVYQALGLRSGERLASSVKKNPASFIRALKREDLACLQQGLFNDLETGILKVRPSLAKLKKRLAVLAPDAVCFSGSGPSVFALTRTKVEAEAIARQFKRQYSQTFVVRTK